GFPSLIVHSHASPPRIGDLLGRCGSYAFVLSDTYHVCVNAWRAGVPALCIGTAAPNPQGFDVSAGWFGAWRDKRYAFYAMHDAMEYYVFSEELAHGGGLGNRVLQATELLGERALAGVIAADMRARGEAAEGELVAELRLLIGAAGVAV
ncbi:MAG: hypothetical protein JOZ15_12885, partial [Acidobacteria bacterium]|nr:hypothetical protein [Acidobacteriota bacterium]